MTKKLLTARFSDGTIITRETEKGYPFAWRAFGADASGKITTVTGFASTFLRAQASANTEKNKFTHRPWGIEVVSTVASDRK